MDKLEGGDTDDTERIGLINIRDTAVADKVILAMIGKIAALGKALIQSAHLLFVKTGGFQLQPCAGFKLRTFLFRGHDSSHKASARGCLEQGDIGLVHDGEQELHGLGVFKAADSLI